ncbi:MAG: NUDIX hydrolase [Streptococcaceae bacterium]|jgi:8-oxo-dGTP diphosphatase|nr:NUDIX hydrolase [Streptococcaceae bacterium]
MTKENRDIPTFGQKEPSAAYETRVGVHAIVASADKQKICLLQTPNGAYYLPGGEIEPGETHETALARELMEEIGATAELGDYLGQADEYYYSSHRAQHYYNPIHAYDVAHVAMNHAPTESGNHIRWFSLPDALGALKRPSHKWALMRWQHKNGL